MSRTGRPWSYLVLLLGSLAFPARVLAADGATPAETGFVKVRVNLYHQGLENLLPFDVPVVFEGPVSAAVTVVSLYRADPDASGRCDWPERPPTGAPVGEWRANRELKATTDAESFHIAVGEPFKAESNYCLLFAAQFPVPPEKIAAVCPQAVSEVVATAAATEDPSALRRTLRDELEGRLEAEVGVLDVRLVSEPSTPLASLETATRTAREWAEAASAERVASAAGPDPSEVQGAIARVQAEHLRLATPDVLKVIRRSDKTLAAALAEAPLDAPPLPDTKSRLEPLEARELRGRFLEQAASLRLKKATVDLTASAKGLDASKRALLSQYSDALDGAARVFGEAASASAAHAGAVEESRQRRDAAIKECSRLEFAAIAGTTTGSFATRFDNYVSADIGFLYGQEVDQAVPYLGVNFYSRPVNKDAPVRRFGGFGRRVSLTVGLTLTGLSDSKDPTFHDLFSGHSLLVGGGLRLTDSTRLGIGTLVFKRKDRNPLADREHIAVAPYVSLSFDWNVRKYFNAAFKDLFPEGK